MKKLLSVIMLLVMGASLVACGNSSSSQSQSQTLAQTQPEPSSSSATEAGSDDDATTEDDATTQDNTEADTTVDTESGSNILVVYFSCTGNTENIAEHIADGLSADIYEIEAEVPYTDADLNWNDSDSRSSVEMDDASSRPAISGSIDNIDQYTTIFIGYPIWWGEAPRILSTFVESYDLDGKTIIPFATSSSSGFGSSGRNLAGVAGAGDWQDGMRFSGNEDAATVMEWVNQFNLD